VPEMHFLLSHIIQLLIDQLCTETLLLLLKDLMRVVRYWSDESHHACDWNAIRGIARANNKLPGTFFHHFVKRYCSCT